MYAEDSTPWYKRAIAAVKHWFSGFRSGGEVLEQTGIDRQAPSWYGIDDLESKSSGQQTAYANQFEIYNRQGWVRAPAPNVQGLPKMSLEDQMKMFGIVHYNPWTGMPRSALDEVSDPEGKLIVKPGDPLAPASTQDEVVRQWLTWRDSQLYRLEAQRREHHSMGAVPIPGLVDYAAAAQAISMAMMALDEGLPNGQRLRCEIALDLLTEGADRLRTWMLAKGYSAPTFPATYVLGSGEPAKRNYTLETASSVVKSTPVSTRSVDWSTGL